MSGESLGIGQGNHLCNLLVQKCPEDMMLREFIMNSLEAATNDKSGKGLVVIGAKCVTQFPGIKKLCIWNNGPGMNAKQLREALKFGNSVNKTMGADANFGIGAKVAGIQLNKLGIRFRTCRNGVVSQAIIHWDEKKQDSQILHVMQDGEQKLVIDVTDVVDEECEYDINEEWTEVVLFGNRAEQDTSINPYDKDKDENRTWIPKYLYERFYSIPKNVEIKLTTDVTPRDATRKFTPISLRLDNRTVFKQYEPVKLDNGIVIHYLHDPIVKEPSGHSRLLSTGSSLSPTKTFVSLVQKGEHYNFTDGKSWHLISKKFGIPWGYEQISIMIELPDNYPVMPNHYRDWLIYNSTKKAVPVLDFAELVFANRPQWLIDIICNSSPKASTDEEVRKELQDYLDRAAMLIESLKAVKNGDIPVDKGNKGVGIFRGKIKYPPNPDPVPRDNPLDTIDFSEDGKRRAIRAIVKKVAPGFRNLWDEKLIEEQDLTDKAGMYDETANEVVINMHYPAFDEIREDLLNRYATHPDQELLEEQVDRCVNEISQRLLGMVVVCAMMKKIRSLTWCEKDIENAMSKESLSMAADNWMNIIENYYRKLSKNFKTSLTPVQ